MGEGKHDAERRLGAGSSLGAEQIKLPGFKGSRAEAPSSWPRPPAAELRQPLPGRCRPAPCAENHERG